MNAVSREGLQRLLGAVSSVDASVGTPFFAYDAATIDRATSVLLHASDMAGLDDAMFYLAFFAAPNTALFSRVLSTSPRLGVTCNTLEEVLALQAAGWTDWDRVVFSGGVLPPRDLDAIAKIGCLIHAASPGNLDLLRSRINNARRGIRVTFDDNALKGLRLDAAHDALARRPSAGLVSAHAYPGTEIESMEALQEHATRLIELTSRSSDIVEINFGGGFWYDYAHPTGDVAAMFDYEKYFTHVGKVLSGMHNQGVRPAWEPGRVVFAGSGFFVASVLEVVQRGGRDADVYLDASFAQIPSPKIRGRQHLVVALDPDGRPRRGEEISARLCGATTLSTDQLLPGPCAVPRVEVGDRIIILDVGAYGRAGSYSFLGKATPPEILLEGEGWRHIRERGAAIHLNMGVIDGG